MAGVATPWNFALRQNGPKAQPRSIKEARSDIAINDNYDTIDPNSIDNDFAGIRNWFNENIP